MKVTFIKTREVKEVNDSYGARLIEQGKAIIHPGDEKAEATSEAEESTRKKR